LFPVTGNKGFQGGVRVGEFPATGKSMFFRVWGLWCFGLVWVGCGKALIVGVLWVLLRWGP